MRNRKLKHRPNCFSDENFREELLESCEAIVLVGFCCCGEAIMAKGELEVVGKDFIVLEDPKIFKEKEKEKEKEKDEFEVEALIIPLNRIFAFVECKESSTEADISKECDVDQTLLEHLAKEHCGDLVDVQFCPCFDEEPISIIGRLVEVGQDFIEIRVHVDSCDCDSIKKGNVLSKFAEMVEHHKKGSKSSTKDVVIKICNVCDIAILEKEKD